MAQMMPMRTYACDEFEKFFMGRGTSMEDILYNLTRKDMLLTGCTGMDFYSFRRHYKKRLQCLLENLKNDKSDLRARLKDVDDYDDGVSTTSILSMNPKEWNRTLWAMDEEDAEMFGSAEMREGTFDCINCARRGLYAKNTSHFEKQTRSADEPMTVFMHCHTCGKDYKFSS